MELLAVIAAFFGVGLLMSLSFAMMLKNFYVKVAQGQALITNKSGGITTVAFSGGLVLPVVHSAETLDISMRTIPLDRKGRDGIVCGDKIRADVELRFSVRVNTTEEDVKKVAQQLGCARASDPKYIEEFFVHRFAEAVKTVAFSLDFEELYKQRDAFKDEVLKQIGTDLCGFVLDDVAIDYLEQTPLSKMDPNNVLDAQGIRKITAITRTEHQGALVGRQCTVTSDNVDPNVGSAQIDLAIRCLSRKNAHEAGREATIVDYDAAADCYIVDAQI